MYWHVSGEVVVSVEDLPALGAGIALLLAGAEASEAAEAGETLLGFTQQFARLGKGKCREPEAESSTTGPRFTRCC